MHTFSDGTGYVSLLQTILGRKFSSFCDWFKNMAITILCEPRGVSPAILVEAALRVLWYVALVGASADTCSHLCCSQ